MEDAIRELAEQLGVGTEMLVSMYVPFVQARAASTVVVAAAALLASIGLIAFGAAKGVEDLDERPVRLVAAVSGAIIALVAAMALMFNGVDLFTAMQAPEASAMNEILERVASL